MMDIRLRLALIGVIAVSILLVIRVSKKARMEVRDATNWLIVCTALLLAALFPELIAFLAATLGITLASNAAFAVVLFMLLCIVFYLNIRISRVSIQNRDLVQRLAILEKRIRMEQGKKI